MEGRPMDERIKQLEQIANSEMNINKIPIFTYTNERPLVMVDMLAIIANGANKYDPDNAKIVLVKRKYDPYKDKYALPGGHVDPNESVEDAVIREFKEETNIAVDRDKIALFGVYSKPQRDPRGWSISIVFMTYISEYDLTTAKASDDAKELYLNMTMSEASKNEVLAFDHSEIVKDFI